MSAKVRPIQEKKKTGLVLSGGGARAAYQVGVLKALMDIVPPEAGNPFDIISGTSAGAINGVALASFLPGVRAGVRHLERVWRNFQAEQVYRTAAPGLVWRATQWLGALFLGGIGAKRPQSLLDNQPLTELLTRVIRFDRVQQVIDAGHLWALSVTVSGYSSGESVSFFQGVPSIEDWRRARRLGVRTELGMAHLLASSAIPAIFPAVKIDQEYFGDGSVRQLAPLSPALHLGADRVLVVGVSANDAQMAQRHASDQYPSIAQIAGHVLNSAFLDSLEGDVERLERINHTISLVPEAARRSGQLGLRPVEILVISPSEALDEIAARHAHELPGAMRFFLRGSGATNSAGSTIVSYLLFEQGFCRDLMALGYKDAIKREKQILRFFDYDPRTFYGKAGIPPADIW